MALVSIVYSLLSGFSSTNQLDSIVYETIKNYLVMTDEENEAAFEKLLIPIKNLYSEITTRGNKFCYPFFYTDADGDYLSYITQLI